MPLQLSHRPRAPAQREVTQVRLRPLVAQFATFVGIGVIALGVDTSIVYAMRNMTGLYPAAAISYVITATVSWALNRNITFYNHDAGPAYRQWGLFLLLNLAGFAVNRGTFAAMVTWVPLAASNPVIATAAGAVSGVGLSFVMARGVIFR